MGKKSLFFIAALLLFWITTASGEKGSCRFRLGPVCSPRRVLISQKKNCSCVFNSKLVVDECTGGCKCIVKYDCTPSERRLTYHKQCSCRGGVSLTCRAEPSNAPAAGRYLGSEDGIMLSNGRDSMRKRFLVEEAKLLQSARKLGHENGERNDYS